MKTLICFALALAGSIASAKDGNDPFAVCHKDMQKFCKDVRPGDGRIVQCMMDNQSRVSSECAALLERKKQPPKQQ